MPPSIAFFMAPGENNTPRGTEIMTYVDHYERKGDIAEVYPSTPIPADVRFQCGDRAFNIELKTPEDAMASIRNGHLGEQVFKFAATGEPTAIVVLGTPHEVYDAARKGGPLKTGRVTFDDILRDFNRYQAFKYSAFAEFGIPTLEIFEVRTPDGTKVIQTPGQEVVRLGLHAMRGGNIYKFLNKNDGMIAGAGALARVPNVGKETAEGLIKAFGDAGHVVMAAKNPGALADVKIGNRKLGKKAEYLHKAFWVRVSA